MVCKTLSRELVLSADWLKLNNDAGPLQKQKSVHKSKKNVHRLGKRRFLERQLNKTNANLHRLTATVKLETY